MPIKSPLLSVLAFALSCWSFQVCAQAHAHDNAHAHDAAHEQDSHAGHGAGDLSLNNGEQWQTDAVLRRGMTEIRVAVDMLTPKLAAGQLNQNQADQLSEVVNGSVNTMIEQCKLEPVADANLHIILAQMLTAAAQVKASPLSGEGIPALSKALESYGHYFNHALWQGDDHGGHAH
jgi:hypothetical protein